MASMSTSSALLNTSLRFDRDQSFRPLINRYDEEIDYKFSNVAKELKFCYLDDKTIKFSRLNTKKIITKAYFSEIQNCKADEINVTGILYLHHCQERIERVTATGDIYLDEIDSITEVISQGCVYVTKNLIKNGATLKINAIKAPHIIFSYVVESDANTFVLENVSIDGPLKVDRRIKTVYIKGDCSKIAEIIFEDYKEENSVVVTSGAKFFGNVINGVLK